MRIDSLALTNFRNYEEQEVVFDESINVFIGENAQGKTNALESIYFLAMGKSHRTSKDSDCIRVGADSATVTGRTNVRGRDVSLRLELSKGGKRALVNGVSQTKMTDFVGNFQVVLFAPEDLQLIKGGPGLRRRFIDMELGQTHPKYLYHLSQYNRALSQRNALLKNGHIDWDYVSVFDDMMALHGSEVMVRRRQFVQQMNHYAAQIYQNISSGREQLSVVYSASIEGTRRNGEPVNWDKNVLQELFASLLVAKRDSDAQARHTTIGPHRDDLTMTLDGQSVHVFASQGQQRTIALSLRLAEIDFIHQEVGDYPVLLLDDVLSELDDHRQRNLVLSMREKVQTIITTTSLAPFHGILESEMRLFNVHSAIISG